MGTTDADTEPSAGSGLFCFLLMTQYLKKTIDMSVIKHEFCPEGEDLTPLTMLRAARQLKLRARQVRIRRQRLAKIHCPFIAIDKNEHFFIIAAISDGKALIQREGMRPESISLDDLWSHWRGQAILMTDRSILPGKNQHFDINWFIPAIVKFRKLFRDILIASFFLQLFALLTPLVFQVVMDKVLVHRAEMTLNVLVIALLAISLFEVMLGGLRTYVFSHTTNRVDVELGTWLFRHLLKLPVAFFQNRPVGQVVARVRELENVRNFLTSSALTLVIDLFFSLLFIAVMFFYSSRLAWIVVSSIPFYIIISILITPRLRQRTEELFHRSAINQAFLTETLTGVETLKSMAIEPQMRQRWEHQLAGFAQASFRSVVTGMYGSQSVQLVNKLFIALLMWQGSLEVIHGHMTVGELIAFNMISGQISAPILRLAQLWQDFQQFRIAIARLGDIINAPTEPQSHLSQSSPPAMKGAIRLENVVFRYSPSSPAVLNRIDLNIPAGQVIGIAGRSGSGKSTLTKLIQRLFIPESGKVYIDGANLSLLNPAWIRRQIGVVLQDSVLFNGTIRDNIALANPTLDMESVIAAAQLAGAHDFIIEMPHGYNSELGERGIGLSGGQLQRLAIARALATQPNILIFDEATSALDYESEKIIQDNMRAICKGRTVIIIAHRLSTIRHCDRIVVIEKGVIEEDGSHNELVQQRGRYAQLWSSQIGVAERV
ncbi:MULTISPECIES: type I secretion system permease/ATPase [unclassified Endozoicomonas]|uniref:type I secretion system permease/ATPase n=1 Tax=unclassified Endozoicomonas TaxID=2644528 RepID=UPI00214887EA|nr:MULTISPECIES: type I secretion system permease/ATPase [unclassified Endozoicomonas]